jgi:hypothetical protein
MFYLRTALKRLDESLEAEGRDPPRWNARSV